MPLLVKKPLLDQNQVTKIFFTETQVFNVEDFGVERVPADIGCNFRTTVRNAGVHSQTLTLTDSNSNTLWSTVDGSCSADTIYLDSGESYTLHFHFHQ